MWTRKVLKLVIIQLFIHNVEDNKSKTAKIIKRVQNILNIR